MRFVTDELVARWSAIDCWMNEATIDSHSLLSRIHYFAIAACKMDEYILSHQVDSQDDYERRFRAAAYAQTQKAEQIAKSLLAALRDAKIEVTAWSALNEKQRSLAVKQPLPCVDAMTSQTLSQSVHQPMQDDMLFRVYHDEAQKQTLIQHLPQDNERILTVVEEKMLWIVPVDTIHRDDVNWATFRKIQLHRKGKKQCSTVCLICPDTASEELKYEVRCAYGVTPEHVFITSGWQQLGNLFRAISENQQVIRRLEDNLGSHEQTYEYDRLLQEHHQQLRSLDDMAEVYADDSKIEKVLFISPMLPKKGPIIEFLCHAAHTGKYVKVISNDKSSVAHTLSKAGCKVITPSSKEKLRMTCFTAYRKDGSGQALLSASRFDKICQGEALGMLQTFASSEPICQDMKQIEQWLCGKSLLQDTQALTVAPFGMRQELLRLIRVEMSHALRKEKCEIRLALPELSDPLLIDTLYDANQAGVNIHILTSGICCLQPGLPKRSDQIEVRAFHHLKPFEMTLIECKHSDVKALYMSTQPWTVEAQTNQIGVCWQVTDNEQIQLLSHLLDALMNEKETSWNLHVDQYTAMRCSNEEHAEREQITKPEDQSGGEKQ